MRKSILAATGIILLITQITALARLGESVDECKARYGEPVGEDSDVSEVPNTKLVVFVKAGFAIGVTLKDGRAVMLNFQKAKKNTLGIPDPISETEIETLLAANAVGEWRAVNSPVGKKQWMSEDGKSAAQQDLMKPSLTFISMAFDKALGEAAKEKEKQNLEGF